uniref:ATP-dependent DNA helicase PIF2 n=1 Tax=Tanacetum cinerariifolium TaxID=118510 RepID=A0A6L2LT67_TANCI|nr:ATP-dependent DNA helicase PIF2 [Tanacetum cinerariifolium]
MAETVIDTDGYAIYRRRDNKVTAQKAKFVYNNKHVVPYSMYLLLKYEAHINVEWCNRSKAIKYLFKCLNKGPDRATIVIQDNVKSGPNVASKQASFWALGPQLRDLFVTILLFCDVSRPLKLWEENHVALSRDILHKKRKVYKYPELQLTKEQLRNYCLVEIQELLNMHGKSLGEFQDLPQPDPRLLTNLDNRLIREALAFDMNKSQANFIQDHNRRTTIGMNDCPCSCFFRNCGIAPIGRQDCS